ncbi:MAG: hypothetical protein ABJA67_08425 [Chthonomonadales bacterium]
MTNLRINTRVKPDGTITLRLPSEYTGQLIEGFLVITSLNAEEEEACNKAYREELRSLAGSITDKTFERGPQGEYEVSEAL